ncbi:uncharacterized protein JCM15063_003808 [Sporobolomyces koalae]|uniref:uncharacterized protein n=1 Tax=Sporobolomyces koalae TaxID=500713 RepID=UPI00316F68AC
MVSVDAARLKSEQDWLRDLARLRTDAHTRFGDVAWVADGSTKVVYAHKCIVYARATGNWQQRFMGVPHSLAQSDSSLHGHSTTSLSRTWTPHPPCLDPPSTSSCSPVPSDSSHSSSNSSCRIRPIVLAATDLDVFETSLDYFYSGGREAEAFAVVLEGFNEGAAASDDELKGTAKLRQDLLYSWRSKLFADVEIVLEAHDGTVSVPFSAHRAILASRSPYFETLLLGEFADSQLARFTLPSPPFTPPSLVFVLGYMYSGTLDFSNRNFNLETVFETWRCAAFLSMATLQEELQVKIVTMVTPQRVPRIYQFAHAPDVSSSVLVRATLPLLLERFEDMWPTPYIGTLDYEPQMDLVSKVKASISPATVAKTSRQTRRLRKKIELERSGWARNVEAMLEAIEERLAVVIANQLPEVVASPGFIELVDGVGFSSDVLEWLLLQLFHQDELKEENAPHAYQALVGSVLLREQGIMVDARMYVEDARNGLLRYIKNRWTMVRDAGGFDRLEPWCLKELADEIEVGTNELLAGDRTVAVRKSPPKRLTQVTRSQAPLSTTRTPTLADPVARKPLATPGPKVSSTGPAPTASTIPRGVRSAATARTAAAISSTAPPAVRRTRPDAAGPNARAPFSSTTPRSASSRTITSNRSIVPPSTAPSVRARTASAASTTNSARDRTSSLSTSASRSTVASRSTAPSSARTQPSLTPSPTVKGRTPPPIRPAPSASLNPTSRARTPSTRTVTSQVRKQPSLASLKSSTSSRSLATKPDSSASTASRRDATATRASPRSRTNSARGEPTANAGTAVRSRPVPAVPALPTSASGTIRSNPRPRAKPPGTSLLSGIPCIVTVKGIRPIRMRAMVRYLGNLTGETGQWVGVEVSENLIPSDANKLDWNDGKKGDVEYFALTPPTPATSSAPSTAPPLPVPPDPAARPAVSRADSLQLPTASRHPRRRSASAEPAAPSGPTKGLFVRPSQIVYVL